MVAITPTLWLEYRFASAPSANERLTVGGLLNSFCINSQEVMVLAVIANIRLKAVTLPRFMNYSLLDALCAPLFFPGPNVRLIEDDRGVHACRHGKAP